MVAGGGDGRTYGVKPHVVDAGAVFVSRELDTPFSAVFVAHVFPCGHDIIL